MIKEQWLTEKQVADMTQRKQQTLRNDRCSGKGIPYSKIGRLVRYRLVDVEAFMNAGRIETKPL